MLDQIFRAWNPLDIKSTKDYFISLDDAKGYKTFFMLEKSGDDNFKVQDGFFYTGEDFPEDFVLDKTSPILKKLREDYKDKDDAFVFDKIIGNLDAVLEGEGVVGGMAYPIFIDEELSGILMVCTKNEAERKIPYESIYIEKDQKDFSEICKKMSSILRIERSHRLKDIFL